MDAWTKAMAAEKAALLASMKLQTSWTPVETTEATAMMKDTSSKDAV